MRSLHQRLVLWMFALVLVGTSNSARAGLKVATDFEGGSARVLSIDDESGTIRFMPGGKALRGWPCWWFLRIEGATPGRSITFELTASDEIITQEGPYKGRKLPVNWAAPDQASVSLDGKSWQRTAKGTKQDYGIRYTVKAEAPTFWLAWGPAFTPADSKALIERLVKDHAFAKAATLTKSAEGRTASMMRIAEGDKPVAERFGVWVEARQHAWEAGGSWVCRGFAEWIASDDAAAQWLRRNAEIFIVPVMDTDHVATGDGGKEALPQDHNRDWTDAPHWPEVTAVQKNLSELAGQKRLDFFIDLHNPAPSDFKAFFFVAPPELLNSTSQRNLDRFLALARENIKGPIPLDPKPRSSGPGYHPLWRQISGNWVAAHGNPHTLAVCLETAWNIPESTTGGYLTIGAQLGHTIERYLRENPRRAAGP